MLLWWERSSPSVFLRVKVSWREAWVVAAQLRVDVARKRDFLLGGDGGDGLRSVADGGIAVVRGENRVLLVGFNQRGALQNALN